MGLSFPSSSFRRVPFLPSSRCLLRSISALLALLAGSTACLHAQSLNWFKATAPPPSASGTLGSLQRVFNPSTGDYFYVSGSNTVIAVNTSECTSCERVVASIPVGAGSTGATSALTLALDATRNLLYAFNSGNGTLYVIDVSHSKTTSMSVVGSLSAAAIKNPGTTLIAVDTGINVVYLAGPTTLDLTEVCGGTSPALIQSVSAGFGYVSALNVDSAHNIAYVVGQYVGSPTNPPYITLVQPTTDLVCSPSVVSTEKSLLVATNYGFPYSAGDGQGSSLDLEPNSIAADSGATLPGLLAVGVPAVQTSSQDAVDDLYDDFQFPTSSNPLVDAASLDFLPITVSLDSANQIAYVTDFNGNLTGGASHATMISGLGSVNSASSPLTPTEIGVFSEASPTSPQVYDAQPDPANKAAWISASDATDGGFIAAFDSATQAVTRTVINAGAAAGGHLLINSLSGESQGMLLDEVNSQLYLLNTPDWTSVGTPTITPPTVSNPVATINAASTNDDLYYTVNTGEPLVSSAAATKCTSPCKTTSLNPGQYYRISAVEEDAAGDAGNVVTEVVAVQTPLSTFGFGVSPSPATMGKQVTATAVLGSSAAITGTVTFTMALGSGSPVTLCSKVVGKMGAGLDFTCNFMVDLSGSYTVSAVFSGDPLNQAQTKSAPLTVNASTNTPVVGNIPNPALNIFPVALNSNNSGANTNVVLYSDSSLSVVQNGQLTPKKCKPFPGLPAPSATLGVQQASVFFDGATNTVYVAMIYVTADYAPKGGNPIYRAKLIAAYETLGTPCTQGPEWLLKYSAAPLPSNLEINVDLTLGTKYPALGAGQMYVLEGDLSATSDQLLMLPIPWTGADVTANQPLKATLDKNVYYGPIVLDTSTHRVFISDLGFNRGMVPGSFATPGFFVYDPIANGSLPPVSQKNLEWVGGYVNAGVKTQFNAATLLTDNAGKLVIVEENPGATVRGAINYPILSVPILHLMNTIPALFFHNTTPDPKGGFYINPGNALVPVKAGCQTETLTSGCPYNGIAGADLNPVSGTVYGFAYSGDYYSTNPEPGSIVSWSLPALKETILVKGLPMPQSYASSNPWPLLNFVKYNTQLAFSDPGNALGISTPVCEGPGQLTISQLVGSQSSPVSISAAAVNQSSGFVYAILGKTFTNPPAAPSVDFVEPLAYLTPTPANCPAVPAALELPR